METFFITRMQYETIPHTYLVDFVDWNTRVASLEDASNRFKVELFLHRQHKGVRQGRHDFTDLHVSIFERPRHGSGGIFIHGVFCHVNLQELEHFRVAIGRGELGTQGLVETPGQWKGNGIEKKDNDSYQRNDATANLQCVPTADGLGNYFTKDDLVRTSSCKERVRE